MVVKSATKKKLMDLGIAEKDAHLLADDRKWADVKELTVKEIHAILFNEEIPFSIGGEHAEEVKAKIDWASQPEINQGIDEYITSIFQSALDSIVNPDDGDNLPHLGPEYGSLFSPSPEDEELVITLTFSQVSFLRTYDSEGPDDEPFLDPNWDHCSDSSCGHCPIHTLHHGIQHAAHNPDGKQMNIWKQCFEQFGDVDSNGTHINVAILYAYSSKQEYTYEV